MLCYVSVSYYASVFSVEKFGRLRVPDEYVELCDLCLRFVFWAVNVNFFRCASGGKFFCCQSGLNGSCCHFEDGRYVWTGVIWFCFVLLFFLSHFRNCF